MLAVAHALTLGRASASFSLPLRSPSPILAATFMPPRGRPTLVVLPPVVSSSVASLSSASSCDAAAACRSRALAASFASRRNSALLARGIFWPLEFIELSSPHIVAQVHSLFEHLYLHG